MTKVSKNQVLSTPTHIAEFICHVTGVDHTKRILDGTCGEGTLLVQSLNMELEDCRNMDVGEEEKERAAGKVLYDHIWGIEADKGAYRQVITNFQAMGGNSNTIKHGNLFEQVSFIRQANPDIILMNPPFNIPAASIPEQYRSGWKSASNEDPTKGLVFLEFISDMIKRLNAERCDRGLPAREVKAAIILPMSAAIGTDDVIAEAKTRLLENNTLDAVFSLPDALFYPQVSAYICCMVFTMGRPHVHPDGTSEKTFFGYYKDDGFVKRQKYGRVEKRDSRGNSVWQQIEAEWLELYQNKIVQDGMSAMNVVTSQDEWLCEAFMQTEYSTITVNDFQETINEYVAFQVKNGLYPDLISHTTETLPLHCNCWKEFRFGNLVADIRKAKPLIKEDFSVGTDDKDVIRFVTRTSGNNGIETLAVRSEVPTDKINPGKAITIGDTTATCFYQEEEFIAGNHVYIVRADWMNTPTALFIVTLLRKERYKYSYGRSFKVDRIRDTVLKLPVDDSGTPNWEYIENFMKSLRYGTIL